LDNDKNTLTGADSMKTMKKANLIDWTGIGIPTTRKKVFRSKNEFEWGVITEKNC